LILAHIWHTFSSTIYFIGVKIFLMKKFLLNLFILFLTTSFLISCGVAGRRFTSTPELYMEYSEYKLCMEYLTRIESIHQENRYIAIQRNGYDCSKFKEQAKAKRAADEEYYKRLEELIDALAECTVYNCTN